MRVGDDLNDASYIVDRWRKYEISAPSFAQLDRGAAALLNDMLDGLIDLQNENGPAPVTLRDRAEGQAAFEVVAQLEPRRPSGRQGRVWR